jgi:hypothetical protein
MTAPLSPSHADEVRGLWFGLLGVTIFALAVIATVFLGKRMSVGAR